MHPPGAPAAATAAGAKPVVPREIPKEVKLPSKLKEGVWVGIRSPDRRMLVFTATNAQGKSELWLQRLNSLAAHPLIAADGVDAKPFWSPTANRSDSSPVASCEGSM